MSARSLILAALIGGVAIAILSNVPIINLANCLLCLWVWLGAIFAVWLYRRFAGRVGTGEGAAVGALAGFIAGLLGVLIRLAGAAALQDSFQAFFQALPPEVARSYNLSPQDFSRFGLVVSCFGLFLFTGIGALAGLIGGAIFRTGPGGLAERVGLEPIPPPGGMQMPAGEQMHPVGNVDIGSAPAMPGEPQPPVEPLPPVEPPPSEILEEPPAVPPDTSLEEPYPPKPPPPEPPA